MDKIDISIHAPLTGSDFLAIGLFCICGISIHAPLTGSDETEPVHDTDGILISIHAPLTGSDSKATSRKLCRDKFQSTLPSQGAT